MGLLHLEKVELVDDEAVRVFLPGERGGECSSRASAALISFFVRFRPH